LLAPRACRTDSAGKLGKAVESQVSAGSTGL
jgi:hypothetical protein